MLVYQLFARSEHFVLSAINFCANKPYNQFMEPIANYKTMIANEFTRRREKNEKYSMRAFSKQLGVSVSTLSEVLNGKRALSRASALKVCDFICNCQEDRQAFLNSFFNIPATTSSPMNVLDVDQFFLISEWYHLAILNLAKLKSNSKKSSWIAKRLGITEREADGALERLLRLGLIKIEGSYLVRTSLPISVQTKTPSSAIKKYHSPNLELAKQALDDVPMELRDISSVTMPIDLKNIDKARELIKKFRVELSEILEAGDPTEIYTLSVQLFPISEVRSK